MTATVPEGDINPCGSAVATIVSIISVPTAKSLKEDRPIACILVRVRIPTTGEDHDVESSFRTAKTVGSAPESTSALTKLNTASNVEKTVPPFVNDQNLFTSFPTSKPDAAMAG